MAELERQMFIYWLRHTGEITEEEKERVLFRFYSPSKAQSKQPEWYTTPTDLTAVIADAKEAASNESSFAEKKQKWMSVNSPTVKSTSSGPATPNFSFGA